MIADVTIHADLDVHHPRQAFDVSLSVGGRSFYLAPEVRPGWTIAVVPFAVDDPSQYNPARIGPVVLWPVHEGQGVAIFKWSGTDFVPRHVEALPFADPTEVPVS